MYVPSALFFLATSSSSTNSIILCWCHCMITQHVDVHNMVHIIHHQLHQIVCTICELVTTIHFTCGHVCTHLTVVSVPIVTSLN